MEQIVQVSSLDPSALLLFNNPFFHSFSVKSLFHSLSLSLCVRVQLATAGELITTGIMIIISMSLLLEWLPVKAAALLTAGPGTSCPKFKHYLVHFRLTNIHMPTFKSCTLKTCRCTYSNLTSTIHVEKQAGFSKLYQHSNLLLDTSVIDIFEN